MIEKLIERENDIFDILQKFIDVKLQFVIVGGYAVSVFKHRFSIDADIVVSSNDLKDYEEILKNNGFKKIISKELKNIYKSKFIRYQKIQELPVNIDLLIDGIGVRQTGASFGFKLLLENSEARKIIGIEKEIKVLIPSKEILIILKIHSGRLTDFRDIAVLAKNVDVFLLKRFILRGDKSKVKKHIKKLESLINEKNFIDSFKGVFMEKKFDIDVNEIKKICKILINLIDKE